MDIDTLSTVIEDAYYSEGFMQVIEDHLSYLRSYDGVVVNQLTNTQCVKYQGDFFGLLNDLKIDKRYHYAVMRVNDLFSPADFTGDINQIVVPNLSQVDMLKNIYQTKP
jgi:hypothetical protein